MLACITDAYVQHVVQQECILGILPPVQRVVLVLDRRVVQVPAQACRHVIARAVYATARLHARHCALHAWMQLVFFHDVHTTRA